MFYPRSILMIHHLFEVHEVNGDEEGFPEVRAQVLRQVQSQNLFSVFGLGPDEKWT